MKKQYARIALIVFSLVGLIFLLYNDLNAIAILFTTFCLLGLAFTFTKFEIVKNYNINMRNDNNNSMGWCNMIMDKKTIALIVIIFVSCCLASMFFGAACYQRFVQQPATITQTQTTIIDDSINKAATKININIATASELETLPGIGELKAKEIIKNRDYADIYDLVEKNIVGKDTFDNIKDVITVARDLGRAD